MNEDATTANLAASLLSNDTDPDTSDVIRITGVTQGAKGSVVFNDGGTPRPGDDTLTYTADGAVLDALAVGESPPTRSPTRCRTATARPTPRP